MAYRDDNLATSDPQMVHKKAVAKLDSDLALSAEPWHTHVGMSDQEIRARALECAVRRLESLGSADIFELVGMYETYIKTGEKG